MKTENLLLFGGLGLGAFYFLSKRGATGGGGFFGGGQQRTFTIPANTYTSPTGGFVPAGTYNESQLPSIGFVQYPENSGNWFHYTQLAPTSGVPAGTQTSGPQWYNQVLNYVNTGIQLYNTAGGLATSINQKIKATAVDWNNSIVTVELGFGYVNYNGNIDPTTRLDKKSFDNSQRITIENNGQQAIIKFISGNQITKQATVDFYNEKLTGFDAGSVMNGIYIGSIGYCGSYLEPNYDTVTKIMGTKKYVNQDTLLSKTEYRGYTIEKSRSIEDGSIYLIITKNGKYVTSPRNIKYAKTIIDREIGDNNEIGAVYNYQHPKSVTHCFDGTYSDAGKGACAYHGGAHEIKLNRKGQRVYTGKGELMHYSPYRKQYKKNWARKKGSDRPTML